MIQMVIIQCQAAGVALPLQMVVGATVFNRSLAVIGFTTMVSQMYFLRLCLLNQPIQNKEVLQIGHH